MYAECCHIKPSGVKCQSPALRGKPFCYFHTRLHGAAGARKNKPSEPLKLPSLEETSGIQIAVSQVLDALASSRLDPRQAGLFLYGLHIASQIAARPAKAEPHQIVRSISEDKNGELLGPKKESCEPLADCDSCDSKDHCVDFTRISLRSLQRLGQRWKRGQDQWVKEDVEREEKMKNPELSQANLWLLELAEEEVAEAAEKQYDEINSAISIIKRYGVPYNPQNLSPALRVRFEQEGIKPKQVSE